MRQAASIALGSLLLGGLCLGGSAWRAVAQHPPDAAGREPRVTDPKLGPAQAPLPAWADELAKIRQHVGVPWQGPLGSLHDGDGAEESAAEFLAELGRVAAQAPPMSPAPFDAGDHERHPSAAEQAVWGDEALTAALRHAARLLDDKAHRLEWERAYAQADGYRKLAHRLRREARALAASGDLK